MAAYGAAISLKNTIQCILQSSRIWLVSPSPQISYSSHILQQAYDAMCHLQEVLLKLDETSCSKIRTKVNDLDERIKESIWEFEDLLESCYIQQILPQLESSGGVRGQLSFSVDLQSLRQSVDCFVERVAVMEAEYDIELLNMPEEEGEPISSRIDFGGINSEIVGSPYQFKAVRDHLLAESVTNCLLITGMAGVGKTTLAKKVFDDPLIQSHFEYRAWVKVGRKCETSVVLACILAQVDRNNSEQIYFDEDYDWKKEFVVHFENILKDKKCLIVLGDAWNWDTRLMDNLPQENVRILFTSRQRIKGYPYGYPYIKVCLLFFEESKKLLGEKLFGEKGFPPHLEELGEKIAYKCEGLPLMIVTIAELLFEEEKSREYWTEVAEKQQCEVFLNAYNKIYEVLFSSYNYLPQYLKMYFLYFGAYPPYRDMKETTLFTLFRAEGFLEMGEKQEFEYFQNYSVELGERYNLILHESEPLSWFSKRVFRVHSCWQHVCKKEASKIKFLHVLQSWDDTMKDQRRLCAHSNTLFAFKEVYDSIKEDCASIVRSLLCLGPSHQYPVPIHAMDFKLLKVLDALQVRFYHFPLEILKLVCLKYLALTCNEELPPSISNLFHLQTLIIHPHIDIRKRGSQLYMPEEIWDMQELQLIDVHGRDLPTPNSDATLDKLLYLNGVSAKSCTREILKRIPNLNQLMIMMELKPYDDGDDNNPSCGLGYISEELQNLDKLVYGVLNPEMKHECMVPLSMFPSTLTLLALNGLGCPWNHMNNIGLLLPNLTELALREYACRGPEWDIESGSFPKLERLVIEDADLVRWRPQHGSLPKLHLLSIRHCYRLQQLEWTPDPSIVTKCKVELVECNLSAVASAKQLRPESLFHVHVDISF